MTFPIRSSLLLSLLFVATSAAQAEGFYNPANSANDSGVTNGYQLYSTIGCAGAELLDTSCQATPQKAPMPETKTASAPAETQVAAPIEAKATTPVEPSITAPVEAKVENRVEPMAQVPAKPIAAPALAVAEKPVEHNTDRPLSAQAEGPFWPFGILQAMTGDKGLNCPLPHSSQP